MPIPVFDNIKVVDDIFAAIKNKINEIWQDIKNKYEEFLKDLKEIEEKIKTAKMD